MRLGGAEEKSADIDACDASMRTTWCARLSVGVDGFCWIAKLGCTVFCHRPVVRDLAVAGGKSHGYLHLEINFPHKTNYCKSVLLLMKLTHKISDRDPRRPFFTFEFFPPRTDQVCPDIIFEYYSGPI